MATKKQQSEETTTKEFSSRMAAHGFELYELDLIGAIDVPLPEVQAEFKTYDISKAPAQHAIELESYEAKVREVELAEKALSAIAQPAPFQPATNENTFFDSIKAQLDSSRDERQYRQILAIAQQRVSDAKEQLLFARKILTCYSYFGDLHDLRQSIVAPEIDAYRAALAAAHTARATAEAAIQRAQALQGGCTRDEKGRESREAYLPCDLELSKINLGGRLPALPPSLDGDGEQDILPRPLAANHKHYEAKFDPYGAAAAARQNDRQSYFV